VRVNLWKLRALDASRTRANIAQDELMPAKTYEHEIVSVSAFLPLLLLRPCAVVISGGVLYRPLRSSLLFVYSGEVSVITAVSR
jgi:hypothetical protein